MDAKSRASRRIVTEWLRQRGYSKKEIDAVQIRQIVPADVNSDGRSDTLLYCDWFDIPEDLYMDPVAYLVLRYQPPGSTKVRTVVVATESEHEELQVTPPWKYSSTPASVFARSVSHWPRWFCRSVARMCPACSSSAQSRQS